MNPKLLVRVKNIAVLSDEEKISFHIIDTLPASSLLEAAFTDQPKARRSKPAEKRFGLEVLHSALAVEVGGCRNGAWPIGSGPQQTEVTIR
jgi:hypothetical protein